MPSSASQTVIETMRRPGLAERRGLIDVGEVSNTGATVGFILPTFHVVPQTPHAPESCFLLVDTPRSTKRFCNENHQGRSRRPQGVVRASRASPTTPGRSQAGAPALPIASGSAGAAG